MAILERLIERSALLGRTRATVLADRLASVDLPAGISVERIDHGIMLSGKRLRRRIIGDVRLRSFADLVKGILQ
jgi:hypothetical protein